MINTVIVNDYHAPLDSVNLNDINYRVAFTVEGYRDSKRRSDPRYVKQFILIHSKDSNGVKVDRFMPFHECTAEDFDEFYPLEPKY